MAYKMKLGKLSIDNTPIYLIDTEEGVMGQATKNGSILLDKNLSKQNQQSVINHEKVHLEQMGLKATSSGEYRHDLVYDDNYVYWKGKKHPRSSMDEGNKKLPWENEAYAKSK